MPYRLAVVGCGAIGGHVVRTVHDWDRIEDLVVHDVVDKRAEALAAEVPGVEAVDLERAVERADVVVEAAAQSAVPEVGEAALARGRTLVVLSVGALADPDLAERLERLAREHDGAIRIPSGALGGLDAVAAAREADLDRVKLTTTKSPESLGLGDVDAPRTVFEGTAREAVRELPKNVNVAAALSLAGVGLDRTEVEVVVDPAVERNRHEVTLEGAFGRARFATANDPSPDNPKTSFLAPLSVVALLRRLDGTIGVGT